LVHIGFAVNKAGNGLAAARPLPKTVPRSYKSPGECYPHSLLQNCITYHNPIYGSKEPFLMTNSIYLKPFDRVRSNHPFWAWPFRTIMIHSSKANTGASSALSLAAKAQEGVLSASLIWNQNIQLSPLRD